MASSAKGVEQMGAADSWGLLGVWGVPRHVRMHVHTCTFMEHMKLQMVTTMEAAIFIIFNMCVCVCVCVCVCAFMCMQTCVGVAPPNSTSTHPPPESVKIMYGVWFGEWVGRWVDLWGKHGCVYATTTTPGFLFYIPAQCKQGWLPGLSCLGAEAPCTTMLIHRK